MSSHVYQKLPGIIEEMKRRRDAVAAAIEGLERAYPEYAPKVNRDRVPPFPAPRLRHPYVGIAQTCAECELPSAHEIHTLKVGVQSENGAE